MIQIGNLKYMYIIKDIRWAVITTTIIIHVYNTKACGILYNIRVHVYVYNPLLVDLLEHAKGLIASQFQ